MEEEKEYSCSIPRNLNKPDTISFGRLDVSLKQIGYVISGGIVCWYGFQLDFHVAFKVIVSTLGLESGLLLAFAKHKGVSMDKALIDSLTYTVRKHQYSKMAKEGKMIVTIQANEKETNVKTTRKSFSV